jgi:hypothetical protein
MSFKHITEIKLPFFFNIGIRWKGEVLEYIIVNGIFETEIPSRILKLLAKKLSFT